MRLSNREKSGKGVLFSLVLRGMSVVLSRQIIYRLPVLLLVGCPVFAMFMTWTMIYAQGSLHQSLSAFISQPIEMMINVFWKPFGGSFKAWGMILLFASIQIALMKVLPGDLYEGPQTAKGHKPLYKDNGLLAFAITIGAFFFGSFLGFYKLSAVYDHFFEIIGALNAFSLVFCLLLYFKGKYAPNSVDRGISGSLIFDYYWGIELYPRVLSIDIKQLTNCRLGMMSWAVLIISFAAKQIELYGFLSNSMMISLVLQLVYISKFFLWEKGYMWSMDIMHDRAGFYICWGCLVWVPSVYTSACLYLVHHPYVLSDFTAAALFLFGMGSIWVNYAADRQRQLFRLHQGQVTIWGQKALSIPVTYQLETGEVKEGALLASGYWGLSRHFHYIPEWLGALAWTLPALFSDLLAYVYPIFLGILLAHRVVRNEKRCVQKYGEGWDAYCRSVPSLLLPKLSFHKSRTDKIVKKPSLEG